MWRAIKVVSLASFLIGCENNDLSKMFFTKPVPAKQVTIVSNENANLGFPISVDILVVKDADLSPVLAEMDTNILGGLVKKNISCRLIWETWKFSRLR